MRSYGMYDASRGLTLALAAALAGLALWGASEVGTQTTGRFWVAMAIVAGAGLVMALASHVGTWTKGLRMRVSPSTFVLAFGFGLVLGQCFDGVPAPAAEEAPAYARAAPAADRPPADEPVTAERRWAAARHEPAAPPPEEAPATEEPTRMRRRMPTR